MNGREKYEENEHWRETDRKFAEKKVHTRYLLWDACLEGKKSSRDPSLLSDFLLLDWDLLARGDAIF